MKGFKKFKLLFRIGLSSFTLVMLPILLQAQKVTGKANEEISRLWEGACYLVQAFNLTQGFLFAAGAVLLLVAIGTYLFTKSVGSALKWIAVIVFCGFLSGLSWKLAKAFFPENRIVAKLDTCSLGADSKRGDF